MKTKCKGNLITPPQPPDNKLIVLHIDDEETLLDLTKMFLERSNPNIQLIPVTRLEELLEKIKEPYDCILSDYKISEQYNGIHICKIVKEIEDKPFILYTGHGSEEVAEEAFASGVDDYIRKEMDPSHFQVLAKRIQHAVDKYRSERVKERYKTRLEALHKYAVEISSAKTIEEISGLSFDAIYNTLEFSFAGIHLIKGDTLYELFTMGASLPVSYEQNINDSGVTVRAVRTGQTQIVPDTRLDPDYVDWVKGMILLSEIAVPLKVEGKVQGILNVESKRLNAFTPDDQNLLETLATHIANAYARINHITELEKSERKWRSLIDSSMEAAFVLEGVKIVYANKRAADMLGYALDELIGMDSLEITSPRDQELVKTRTLARQRGEAPPHQYELSLVRKDGTEVPVETNASLIEYEGNPASLSFCRDMSERKTFEDKFYRLHQSTYKFDKARTPEDVYDIALSTIQHVLGFSFAGIAITQDDVLIYEKTIGHPLKERWVIDVNSRSVTARTYRTGRPQIIPDISLDGDYLPPPTEAGDDCTFKSELAVPMNDNGETIGVINVESCEDNAFNQYDARLIETLANHSAAALRRINENDGRTRHEDRRIQFVDDNVTLHAHHPPATET